MDRKKSKLRDFAILYGSGNTPTQLFVDDLIKDLIIVSEVIDDETISCKDPSSGVKCPKVKKGKHYKPFYQKGRY